MPQLPPYIPAKDADLDNWATNFSTLITASPATYGLTSGDASAIAAVYTTWHTDYLIVTSPTTKTMASVAAKNAAKISLLATIRPYAQNIGLNAGVTTSNKVALGINPRTSTPTPITAPTTYPVLGITQTLALQAVLTYRDQMASPTSKAKPYGAIGTQIFATASVTPITDPSALNFITQATKSPLLIAWQSADVGKKAYYAARWVTRAGLVGPWSAIISFTIAG